MTTVLPTATLNERPEAVKAIRAYLRQSLDKDSQKESIAVQLADIERLAYAIGISRAAWRNRIDYPDVDRAGDDFAGREQLQKLLREAQPGDLILAWKQDRVGRDMIDSAATIRELVKYRGCHLYTAENGTSPITLNSAEQTAIVLLRGMTAQSEVEKTRDRVRTHLEDRARRGYASGPVPFGYRTVPVDPEVPDSLKRIVIDDAAAAIVRQVFQLYADGHGVSAIARRLNKGGALSARGNGWSPSKVWDLIRSPRYKGEWTHGERKNVARKGDKLVRRRAAESEIIRMAKPELALIPPDEWDRVQKLIAERARDVANIHVRAEHMLTKTLRCDECGGLMHVKQEYGRTKKWVKRYYICTERRRTARCGNSRYLPADDVERLLIDHVRTAVFPQIEAKVHARLAEALQQAGEIADARGTEADKIREQLEELHAEQKRLVKLAAATDAAEVVDALCTNQERVRSLQQSLAAATQPAIDETHAAQLETMAREQLERMRHDLDGADARATIAALFPAGLRFKMGNGLWLIEGAASVPCFRTTSEIRLPVARAPESV